MNFETGKVLIVYDDLSDVCAFNKMLREGGVQDVQAVETAYEASKYMVGLFPFEQRSLPDLILVDSSMPGQSGFHFISSLKGNPLYRNIPLVAFSHTTEPSAKDQALKAGANAYYEKTMGAEELQALVENLLSLNVPPESVVLQD
ncbi:MAG: response regulator [Verrucomicrobiota bacterium]